MGALMLFCICGDTGLYPAPPVGTGLLEPGGYADAIVPVQQPTQGTYP